MTTAAMGYAFEHEGTVFTPDGRAQIDDVEAHNAALERAELAEWATAPDRWAVYVPIVGARLLVTERVTTWRGAILGTIISAHRFSTNISRNMVAIRFKGTNGATYYGRYGADWSQLCRVRKVRQ